MVIAGVVDTERSQINYKEMGCKDSKLLTPKKREELYKIINESAKEIISIEISAGEIDRLRSIMSLNEVEAKKIADLILSLKEKPDKIIIDCPDTEPKRFLNRLRKYLGPEFNAVIEHKADVNHPIVSAASIIAKVNRDNKIQEYKKMYGNIGSGYPADPVTQKFLETFYAEHEKLPPITRKSWETSKRFLAKKEQSTLSELTE
jgi:ribonuclease HII